MELVAEPCSVASVVNFLPPDFPLPTSDPFEGHGDRARGEEGGKDMTRRCPRAGGEGHQ